VAKKDGKKRGSKPAGKRGSKPGGKSAGKSGGTSVPSVSDLLRVPAGTVDLAGLRTKPGPGPKDEAAARNEIASMAERLSELQERLYAQGRAGGSRRLLLVCQGMDTSGKGGVMRHVVGLMDPQGCAITAFKAPTKEELAHDFLWRIRLRLPGPGMVSVFDRSHYEDVLVVRVRELAPRPVVSRRYATINRFEQRLVDSGTTVVKVMLHLSAAEQRRRLLDRLDDPSKHWKYNPRDVDERALWQPYREAYEIALEKCNTPAAPWYVVPSDAKWYRDWAITRLLVEHLEAMDLGWPAATFDVAAERARVESS